MSAFNGRFNGFSVNFCYFYINFCLSDNYCPAGARGLTPGLVLFSFSF